MRAVFVLTLFSFFVTAALPYDNADKQQAPKLRDLPPSLKDTLCRRDLSPEDFWAVGWTDAQVGVVKLYPKSTKDRFTENFLKGRSLSQALQDKNYSYSFGVCGDGSAWMVSFPGRETIQFVDGKVLMPPSIKTQCQKNTLDMRFVKEDQGRSMRLLPVVGGGKEEEVFRAVSVPRGAGYVSVACEFLSDRDGGIREISLFPVGGVNPKKIESAYQNITSRQKFFEWINQERSKIHLKPLLESSAMNQALISTYQKVEVGVKHSRIRLRRINQMILSQRIELLGENRAVGGSYAEVAKLFWISPAHRDLLLDPAAEIIGIYENKSEKILNLSLIVGKHLKSEKISKQIRRD